MKLRLKHFVPAIPILAAVAGCDGSSDVATGSAAAPPDQTLIGQGLIAQGKEIFRTETFGDEAFC